MGVFVSYIVLKIRAVGNVAIDKKVRFPIVPEREPGADFQYNVTYEYAHFAEVSPFIKNWMDAHFDGSVVPKVEKEGNVLTHYLEFNGRDVSKGIASFIATPRFATGYAPLRNRAGLLIETHMLKPYNSRVRGTYDVLRYTVEEIGKNKSSLF